MKTILPVIAFIAFTIFSVGVVVERGVLDLFWVLGREPWAAQFFVDVCIACFLVGGFMIRDAKKLGIVVWPYLVLMPFLGSIASLAYFVRRSLVRTDERA